MGVGVVNNWVWITLIFFSFSFSFPFLAFPQTVTCIRPFPPPPPPPILNRNTSRTPLRPNSSLGSHSIEASSSPFAGTTASEDNASQRHSFNPFLRLGVLTHVTVAGWGDGLVILKCLAVRVLTVGGDSKS